jgi:hypothetical protein
MKGRIIVLIVTGVLGSVGTVRGTPIRPGFDSFSLPKADALWSADVSLGFNLDFFGISYSHLCVNTDGNVTLLGPNPLYVPIPFNMTTTSAIPIIAPFFADVDLRGPASDTVRYGPGVVDGHTAFGVNWVNVGYFWKHDDKLNSFQLVLIDRSDRGPGDADIEFNYGQILWESGDLSEGENGFGGLSARAGYTNGTGNPGTFYEIPGSGIPGSFLDSSPTGLIRRSFNSSVPGRYVFPIIHDQESTIPAPAALFLGGIGWALVVGLRRCRRL